MGLFSRSFCTEPFLYPNKQPLEQAYTTLGVNLIWTGMERGGSYDPFNTYSGYTIQWLCEVNLYTWLNHAAGLMAHQQYDVWKFLWAILGFGILPDLQLFCTERKTLLQKNPKCLANKKCETRPPVICHWQCLIVHEKGKVDKTGFLRKKKPLSSVCMHTCIIAGCLHACTQAYMIFIIKEK